MNQQKKNMALYIVMALGAYCPRVKIGQDELSFNLQKLAAKRRKRPLLGRGFYGEGLRAHFARKRVKAQ